MSTTLSAIAPEPASDAKLPPLRAAGLALALGCVGFLANWLRLPLFFNIDYLFGSFFTMLAIQLLGWRWGALSGLLAASCTWWLWNHPYAAIIFSAEAVLTGLIYERRRGDLLLANLLYWLFVGIPLVLLCYNGIMQISLDSSLSILFKQIINGIANTCAARLVITGIYRQLPKQLAMPYPASLREILSTLLAFFVIYTSLVLLLVDCRQESRKTELIIAQMLKGAALQAETFYRNQALAQQGQDEQRTLLQALVASTRNNLRVHYTLFDSQGAVLERSRPDPPLTILPAANDRRLQSLDDNVQRWSPELRSNISIAERWRHTVYLLELPLGDLRLLLAAPAAPWIKPLNAELASSLAIVTVLATITVLVSNLISNRITRSLRMLGEATSCLPNDLTGRRAHTLPTSSVPEVSRLVEGFKTMSDELATRFAAQQGAQTLLANIEAAERNRLARELHDGVAQSLQGVRINLQLLKAQATEGKPCAADILSELVAEIGHASDELRDVTLTLRPSLLDSMGLSDAIAWLADSVGRRNGITIHLHQDCSSGRIVNPLATHLFSICQEALTNCIRHSRANEITITLVCHEHTGHLSIRDNGIGGASRIEQGFGITIMQQRAELCHGSFSLHSPPGQGTELTVEVPLV